MRSRLEVRGRGTWHDAAGAAGTDPLDGLGVLQRPLAGQGEGDDRIPPRPMPVVLRSIGTPCVRRFGSHPEALKPHSRSGRATVELRCVEKLRQCTDPRWARFRAALVEAANVIEHVASPTNVADITDKERGDLLLIPNDGGSVTQAAHKSRDKRRIQAMMQRVLSREPFYRSAIIDVGDKCAHPSMWGSGGNDGAMDFSARYMQNLLLVIDSDRHRSGELLLSALVGNNVKTLLKGSAGKVGQFLPGGAGGANSTQGFGDQNDTSLNPWDFVLMLEGAVCFTSHVSRQSEFSVAGAAPFAVRAHGVAYSSASAGDESARGEQWMPLWSRPSTYTELRRLLGEGRAQLGAKSVREPLDLARAVQRLGTARGIKAFQRYGYIERNGQSNLAVPLGRFQVTGRASGSLGCLDDLDSWMRRLRREARNSNAPKNLGSTEKRLADALFAVREGLIKSGVG